MLKNCRKEARTQRPQGEGQRKFRQCGELWREVRGIGETGEERGITQVRTGRTGHANNSEAFLHGSEQVSW